MMEIIFLLVIHLRSDQHVDYFYTVEVIFFSVFYICKANPVVSRGLCCPSDILVFFPLLSVYRV